jgi:hypothetical protein
MLAPPGAYRYSIGMRQCRLSLFNAKNSRLQKDGFFFARGQKPETIHP